MPSHVQSIASSTHGEARFLRGRFAALFAALLVVAGPASALDCPIAHPEGGAHFLKEPPGAMGSHWRSEPVSQRRSLWLPLRLTAFIWFRPGSSPPLWASAWSPRQSLSRLGSALGANTLAEARH
jgi:hypothetical protein